MLVKACCSAVTQERRHVEENVEGAAPVRRKTVVLAAGFYIYIYDLLILFYSLICSSLRNIRNELELTIKSHMSEMEFLILFKSYIILYSRENA